jgi:hypothetical protein
MTPPAPVRFGQVWESPDEAIGSMRYLVVSSDAYNDAFGAGPSPSRSTPEQSSRASTANPSPTPAPPISTGSPGSPATTSCNSSATYTPTVTPTSPKLSEVIRTLIGNL